MSPTEFDLRRHLDHEAEHIDATGDFAGVVFAAKRRSDRRRVAGVAAAAVLAMALPVAWSVGGQAPVTPATTPAPSPSTEAPSATSPTASASTAAPTPAPTVTALVKDAQVTASPTLSGTFSDKDPGVPYSASGVFHDASRTVTGPLVGGYPTFARLADGGYIVRATSGSDQRVYIVSTDGPAKVLAGAQAFVVSADRTRIAWTDGRAINTPGEGRIHIADASGTEVSTVKVDGTPTALVGDALFAIKLAGYDFAGESVRVNLTTGVQTRLEGNLYAVHADSGLAILAGSLPPEPDPNKPADSCYRIVDVLAASPVTRLSACGDFMPTGFSPNGRYLLALNGQVRLVVADVSDGRVVLDALGSSGLVAESARMTDDGSALVMSVTSADFTHNGLVRCELTGTCEQVGGPALKEPAPEDSNTPRTAYGVSVN